MNLMQLVLELYSCNTQLLGGKIKFYASIMPQFKSCRKLCWHNIRKPTKDMSDIEWM